MKVFFKLASAALAVLALASCSSDDLLGDAGIKLSNKNTLNITVEDMGTETLNTRTAYTKTNKRIWEDGVDAFTVYTNEVIGKYDYYVYDAAAGTSGTGAFVLETGTNKDVDDPEFVAFPKSEINTTKWDKATGSATIQWKIPNTITYGEISGSDPVAYLSNLPMWGTAEANGDDIDAKVYFLTAFIKVYLTNAFSNATNVRVRAYSDIAGTSPVNISGYANAVLSENNVAKSASEVQLTTPTEGAAAGIYQPKNEIVVNLPAVATDISSEAVIFIPIIAGHYGNVQVEYSNDNGTSYTQINEYLDQTFVRATPYGANNSKKWDITSSTVSGINTALASKVDASETSATIQWTGSDGIDVDVNTITIPAMTNLTDLTLDINKYAHASSTPLNVTGDYAGKVTLKTAAFTTNVNVLNINLPKAQVVIAGTNTSATAINVTNASKLFIGDGSTVTNIATAFNGTVPAEVGDISILAKATIGNLTLATNHKTQTVSVAGTAGDIIVPTSKLATGVAVNVAGTAGDITVNGATNDAAIEVSGIAKSISTQGTGAVTLSGFAASIANVGGDVTISGAPNYKTAAARSITGGVDYAKVATVTTSGNVTVALNAEGAAVGTSLTMNAAGKTLTLTQGYVKSVAVPTSGSNVTIALGTDTNYKNLIIGSGTKYAVTGETKWNGNKIGDGIPVAAGTDVPDAATKTTITTDWQGYKEPATAVYTATGLAENPGTFTLKNNIDLNNQPWSPVAQTAAVDGGGKTIRNLTVKAEVDGSTVARDAGRGLFTTIGCNVSNLTLSGVTINATAYKVNTDTKTSTVVNIGALAGKATATVALTKVKVENATITSTPGNDATNGGGAYNIGGLIGQVGSGCSPLTLSGVTVTGSTISGYKSLGGFVGDANGDVTIKTEGSGTGAVKSSVSGNSFVANYNSATTTPAIDVDYLRVGNYIGSASTAKTIDITCDAAQVSATLTQDITIFPGYTKYNEGVNFYDYIFGQHLIGFSGNTTFTTVPTINTKSYQLATSKPDPVPATYLYYINK
ncbi:MAG: hypothetical protein IJ635_00495 [Bacteroidaceae bacterium]|nr:hypothetical protein [Bacteroidaceae bacterium]